MVLFPAAFIGLGFNHILEPMFDDLFVVSVSLIFHWFNIIFYFFYQKKRKDHTFINSILIGLAQAVAIIPGISRSGMTISTALLLGISPKKSAKFSFLLAIPVISGAGLVTALNNNSGIKLSLMTSLAGLITAFLVGVIALKWLLVWLEKGKLHYFGIYCIFIGTIALIL